MRKILVSILFVVISCVVMAGSKQAASSHIVAKGETLYSIAKKYHVTVEALEMANKSSLGENYKLKIGQKISIPASASSASEAKSTPAPVPAKSTPKPAASQTAEANPTSGATTHIVARGETVYAIARSTGLTWRQIKEANHLPDDMKLKVGQKLIIPSRNEEAMYKASPKEPKPESKPEPKPAPKPAPASATEQGRDYMSSQSPPAKKADANPESPAPAPVPAKPARPARADKAPVPQGDENPFAPRPESTKTTNAQVVKNENIKPDDYTTVFNHYNDSGKKKVVYRGIGIFMQTENPGNQFLALYNYADMGSVIKVTNLMSKEAIYVKVIGKVPSTDAQKDVILKLSAEAAAKLKVKEDKFLVEVTGYNME